MIWAERQLRLNAGPRITAHLVGRIWITVVIEVDGILLCIDILKDYVEADSGEKIIKGHGLALVHCDIMGKCV